MEKIIAKVGTWNESEPGKAAVAGQIYDEKSASLDSFAKSIGNAKKDYTAYMGVLSVLEFCINYFDGKTQEFVFEILVDNELVVSQLNNQIPVFDPSLIPLFMAIHNLRIENFPNISIVKSPQNIELNNLARSVS